ncbi:MAG: DUF368 domain-containing protein [Candidatus Woesearchaeota archaeon]
MRKNTILLKYEIILVFLKGILMGICDIIPGISGGTIAFITGIYERLITKIKNYNHKIVIAFLGYLFTRKNSYIIETKKRFKDLDLLFFLPLGFGILLAIIIGANIIPFLLENFYSFTMLFFLGLILSSCYYIYTKILTHTKVNLLFGFLGFLFGILVINIIPFNSDPTILYIYLSGILAISAMFLPGISGSYILLILGLYEYMLNALRNILDYIFDVIIFILGAISGVFLISRIVSYLLERYHSNTLYFLLGLVIGSLFMPLSNIYYDFAFNVLNLITGLLLFFFGFISVFFANFYMKKIKNKV